MGGTGLQQHSFSLMDGHFTAAQMEREADRRRQEDTRSTRGVMGRGELRTNSVYIKV